MAPLLYEFLHGHMTGQSIDHETQTSENKFRW